MRWNCFVDCVCKGSEEVKSASAPVTDVQEHRWQHPEKQKTLIHTAPVLSPLQPTVLGASPTASPLVSPTSVSAPTSPTSPTAATAAAATTAPISSHCSSAGSAIRAVRGKGREDMAKNSKEVKHLEHFLFIVHFWLLIVHCWCMR